MNLEISNCNIDKFIEKLKRCKKLNENEVKQLCDKAKEIFNEETNLVNVDAPVTICGDIHGQFDDLIELFSVGGNCPDTNYVFMGDYVDRGANSVETISLLISLKIKFPDRITLIRGNHETRGQTLTYGFNDECARKYGSSNVWLYFTELFDFFPISALIDSKIFCVHGGLSPNISYIDEIQQLDRKQEVPHNGPFCDLLWSDPYPGIEGFNESFRGAGYLFGEKIVKNFNRINNIELIARAHQVVMEGYKTMFDDSLVTVWSAPNYCGKFNNVASILEFDEHLNPIYRIFEAAPQSLRKGDSSINSIPVYFL